MSERSSRYMSTEERDMRAAVQYAVAQICTEEEMTDGAAHMSSQAVTALSEFVFQYATTCLSSDLVAFARHANRRTITLDDVQLVARKDPEGLAVKLKAFAERENLQTSGRRESAGKSTSPKESSSNNAATTPMTHRMRAFQERLKRGIDSSSEDDASTGDKGNKDMTKKASMPIAYTVDDSDDDKDGLGRRGKENRSVQPANTGKTDDPFASSEDEKMPAAVNKEPKTKATSTFLPNGTKTGFSDDDSDEDMFS